MAGSPNDVPAAANDAHLAALSVIEAVDPVISGAIRGELANQRSQLKLIASENYVDGHAPRHGELVLRQVRRGHHRPPLLRGLRGR